MWGGRYHVSACATSIEQLGRLASKSSSQIVQRCRSRGTSRSLAHGGISIPREIGGMMMQNLEGIGEWVESALKKVEEGEWQKTLERW